MAIFGAKRKGLTMSVMDWNSDGETSLLEMCNSFDIDVREVILDGKKCREYYSLKDGLKIKLVC
jgi:hypothetical protein